MTTLYYKCSAVIRWVLLAAVALSISCNKKAAESPRVFAPLMTESESPNKVLLTEANRAAKWFHAKKTRPIWVKLLESAQTVKTLEGDLEVAAGSYLCRGEAREVWPQGEKELNRRYTATDEVDADGWRKYAPHPDAQGVMAMQIDHPFEVQAKWGKFTGKKGDFLAKNYTDREVEFPEDVWIVDQTLFGQTYQAVAASK